MFASCLQLHHVEIEIIISIYVIIYDLQLDSTCFKCYLVESLFVEYRVYYGCVKNHA